MSKTIRRKNTDWFKKYYVESMEWLKNDDGKLYVYWERTAEWIIEYQGKNPNRFTDPEKYTQYKSAIYHSDQSKFSSIQTWTRRNFNKRHRKIMQQQMLKAIRFNDEENLILEQKMRKMFYDY